MLQSIRDRTHGWIATLIISLVILSFGLWGIHAYVVSSANTAVVAKVNGIEITKTQLAGAYERVRRQVQVNTESNNLTESVESDLKAKALDALINLQVMKQGSIKQDYRVSSRQVDGFLESMPEFQVSGHFSMPRLQQYLSTTLLSPTDFLDLIQSNLLIEQPRLGIIFSSFALPDEVNNTIQLVNQERDFDYISISKDTFLKDPINVSDAEIESYYNAHQNDFKTPEKVSVDYLDLNMTTMMNLIPVTDQQLKTFYDENINNYTKPMQIQMASQEFTLSENASDKDVSEAETKAKSFREDLLNTNKSDADAATFNQDTKLRKWVSLNEIPVDLQRGLSGLTKPGDISQPILTSHGYIVVKIFDVKQAEVESFDSVKPKVADALRRQEAEAKYSDLRDKLANVTYEYPDSLSHSAKVLGLSIHSTELFTHEKGGTDISSNKKVRDAAFSPDVLNAQENSDVIQISNDYCLVLRVKSHIPASLLPLASVKTQIISQITAEKAEAKAQELANTLKAELQKGGNPEALAASHHLTWNKVGYTGRYSTKVDSAVLYAAFRMPKISNSNSYDTAKIPSGFAVVSLKGIQDGDLKDNPDQYDVFAEQVQNSEGIIEYKLYEQSLLKQAKIVSYLDSPSSN